MKRMIREMKVLYSGKVRKEMLTKLALVYMILAGFATILHFKDNSWITPIDVGIFAIGLPVILLIALALQWYLDFKPITDRLYEEEKLKRKWSFIYNRFNQTH